MLPEQIKIVKKTWRMLNGIDPKLIGDAFYSKLFTDHPSLRKLFPENMEQQYIKLVDMLTSIIIHLDKPQDISDDIASMAKRHIGYGVKPGHYEMVGNALLWTLEVALEKEWTEEVKEAWTTCYQSLTKAMLESK